MAEERLHARLGMLWRPTPEAAAIGRRIEETRVAARLLGIWVQSLEARTVDDFEEAFSAAAHERSEGLIVVGSALFNTHRARLTELAARARLAAVYPVREWWSVQGFRRRVGAGHGYGT
jgi:putative tryptophan/tyrosine transport system substrate-binding protein